jgi:hypothetical protein
LPGIFPLPQPVGIDSPAQGVRLPRKITTLSAAESLGMREPGSRGYRPLFEQVRSAPKPPVSGPNSNHKNDLSTFSDQLGIAGITSGMRFALRRCLVTRQSSLAVGA